MKVNILTIIIISDFITIATIIVIIITIITKVTLVLNGRAIAAVQKKLKALPKVEPQVSLDG